MSGVYDWFDTYTVTQRKNIARLLDGTVIHVTGDPENGERELELWVNRVTDVTVGIDSAGVFAGIEVEASVGPHLEGANPLSTWLLLSNGNVTGSDYQVVGRHQLATKAGVPSVLAGARSQVMS